MLRFLIAWTFPSKVMDFNCSMDMMVYFQEIQLFVAQGEYDRIIYT